MPTVNEAEKRVVAEKGKVFTATEGMNFNIGEFEVTLLAYFPDATKENDRSIITMAKIGNKKFLFTGDAEKVTEAFKIMLKNPKVKGILVNIFGGIMKCDTIATGVVTACKAVNLSVPLVVRMKGTNEELGKQILAESGLPIIAADTMAEAATKIVAAVK